MKREIVFCLFYLMGAASSNFIFSMIYEVCWERWFFLMKLFHFLLTYQSSNYSVTSYNYQGLIPLILSHFLISSSSFFIYEILLLFFRLSTDREKKRFAIKFLKNIRHKHWDGTENIIYIIFCHPSSLASLSLDFYSLPLPNLHLDFHFLFVRLNFWYIK